MACKRFLIDDDDDEQIMIEIMIVMLIEMMINVIELILIIVKMMINDDTKEIFLQINDYENAYRIKDDYDNDDNNNDCTAAYKFSIDYKLFKHE